jgi:hypothetical protein
MLVALHPVQRHPERVANYIQYENTLNFLGIDFPVTFFKVEKFEKQNNLEPVTSEYLTVLISILIILFNTQFDPLCINSSREPFIFW